MKRVLAIRHVFIEDLGMWESILRNLGFDVDYLDTAQGQRLLRPLEDYSLLVVLGGYMGAYEENLYPFLSYEFRVMEEAIKKDIAVLGVCLGAQMLAKMLGARVYKGEEGKEIGWMEVYKVSEHPYFEAFPEKLLVFQWHGDTFDLPAGAVRVYSSRKYSNQAFVYGKAVGLQFHLEVDKPSLQRWIEVYTDELKQEGIEPTEILNIGDEHVHMLKNLSESLLSKLLFA